MWGEELKYSGCFILHQLGLKYPVSPSLFHEGGTNSFPSRKNRGSLGTMIRWSWESICVCVCEGLLCPNTVI